MERFERLIGFFVSLVVCSYLLGGTGGATPVCSTGPPSDPKRRRGDRPAYPLDARQCGGSDPRSGHSIELVAAETPGKSGLCPADAPSGRGELPRRWAVWPFLRAGLL